MKLGKPVGGVDGPCCAAGWGPDWAEGCALNPPVDGFVGIALWVAAWLD